MKRQERGNRRLSGKETMERRNEKESGIEDYTPSAFIVEKARKRKTGGKKD